MMREPPSFWTDGCGIDDSTVGSRQQAISSLDWYMKRSDKMLVMHDGSYLSQLASVVELATFCTLRGSSKDDQLMFVSRTWPSYLNPLRWLTGIRLSSRELQQLRSFSCRKASCAVPADRASLLALIRKQFGSVGEFEHFVRAEVLELCER